MSAVRIAGGSGHLARRDDALLFLPVADHGLLEAFVDAPGGGELQAVASSTVGAGFAVAAFVCLSWRDGLRVMAFGDVAVETDQPTLPMLTGAGSRTWVEHSLSPDGPVLVTVGDVERIDALTDVGHGVALAGGFRLELPAPLQPAPDPAAEFGADVVRAVPFEPSPPSASPAGPPPDDAEDSADAPDAPEAATEAVPRPAMATAPDSSASSAPVAPFDASDPHAALVAIQAAAVDEDGEPIRPVGVTRRQGFSPPGEGSAGDEGIVDAHEADLTLPPPDADDLLADVAAAGEAQGPALVDAKLCPNRHPNPPSVATCAICGELLAPGRESIVHVPRPPLGSLVLDNGTVLPLDHELLIGRNPNREDDPRRGALHRVRLPGDKVSRRHLEIRFQGWDVLVNDCGSTNGTFIVPHRGGQVVALEANRPQMVEPGAVVFFGSRSFTVVGREG